MAHIHSVYDTDKHFTIIPATRVLENQTPDKVCVMQYDHDSERITFDLPAVIEGHNIMDCNKVEVHYLNIDAQTKAQRQGLYEVGDLQLSPADEAVAICSWLISMNATQLVGPLYFRVTFKCVTGGNIDYSWSTAVYKGLTVSDGINCTEYIAEQYADVLADFDERLCAVEAGGGGGSGGGAAVEPAEDDIPKVFFGGALQQTKDEAVVPFRYISKTQDVSGYAEIKAQGNSSMNHPKKNQTVKMYKDAACEEKLKVDFKGWGKQSKHCYKANWIDLTHARNVVSARLWADVVKSRANYAELPELLRTSPNQGAVDGFPIKVYANGVYQGRYTLNIPKDAWMANMDDELDNHCILCGEGYASGCFRQASVAQWTDEVHDSMPSAIRTRWLEVINFVMNSTDEDFKANLGNYFDVESLLDYHLFGLVSCGLDAYGKNQLYMTYDGQKWIASMYDMDSTWGLWWTGQSFMPADYARSEYQDFKDGEGNLLYIRLENLFYNELQARWMELRSGALSIENIINRFERFTDIASEELVKEDYATTTANGAFSGIPSKDKSNIQQIRAFAVARHAWTDEYIRVLVPVPCTGVSLSQSAINFTKDGESVTLTATLTPTDTTDKLTWESSNTAVATVENGVVTCVGMGNAVITARCGARSATCAVAAEYVVVPCTGITLSASSLTFTEAGKQTLVATVEPANTTDAIAWSVSPAGIVTVENGVVTAVENGACAVTATCGEKSATCSVTVSGIFVAGEVDYSFNPLANAVWVSGEEVVQTTGVIQTKADTDRTEKIVVQQNCSYKMSGGQYMRLSVWDSEDNYVGMFTQGNSDICLPVGYKFIFQAFNGADGFSRDNLLLTPVNNSASAKYQVINLSEITWTANAGQKCLEGTIATAISKVDSSNYPLIYAAGGYMNGPTTGGKLMFAVYNGTLLIVRGFGTDATTAAAYFAENGTKLILNARQA